MALALRNTNRYPGGNRPRRVPDIRRTRPLPSPLPHQRKAAPVVPPANTNMPGSPLSPLARRALRLALRGTRLARLTNPLALVAGEVLDELLVDPMLVPTGMGYASPAGAWTTKFDCPTMNAGNRWDRSTFLSCVIGQGQDVANGFSPEDLASKFSVATTIAFMKYYINGVGAPRKDGDICFTRPSTSAATLRPLPAFVPMVYPQVAPWPRYIPLPDPINWPVGLPMPAIPPAVRPLPGPTARSASSPNGRGPTRGNYPPGEKRKPRKNRDDLDENPRKPEKGVKEKKGTGDASGLMGAVNRAASQGGRTLGAASELLDLVEALFGALPEDIRRQYGTSPNDMLIALYRFTGEIDLETAVTNLAKNQVEDFVVGGAIGRAERVTGIKGLVNRMGMPRATLEQNSGGTVSIVIEYGLM